MKHRDYVSFSALGTYNKCPRAYYLKYKEGHEGNPQNTMARDIGSYAHELFEVALKGDTGYMQDVLDYWERTEQEHPPHVSTVALDIAKAYLPVLGIGSKIFPYIHEGKPAIEIEVRRKLQAGIDFMGYADAIVTNSKGENVLIDWKFKTYLTDKDLVIKDAQLYLYYDSLTRLGVRIDKVLQVQMLNTPPALPLLKQDGTFNKKCRKTTRALFDKACKAYDLTPDEIAQGEKDLESKIKPMTTFMRMVEIPVGVYTNMMLSDFEDGVTRLMEDNFYRRVASSYACSRCDFKSVCI